MTAPKHPRGSRRIAPLRHGRASSDRGRSRPRICQNSSMLEGGSVTAWDPPKGAQWVPMAIYGGIMSLVVWGLPVPGWWNVLALAIGWLAVAVVGSRLYAPTEYVLSADSLTRHSRRGSETIELSAITSIYGYYEARVGDFIAVQSRTVGFDLQLGGEIDALLEALGARLVELERDREVIGDEKTRRWLGLSGGGLRDPWSPKH